MKDPKLSRLIVRAKWGICFVSILVISTAALAQESLPPGWRKPHASELNGAWRSTNPSKFLVAKGDFDGDGYPDVAELLMANSGQQFSLFVRLSSDGQWKSIHGGRDAVGNVGIRTVPPGKYDTVCRNTPTACADDALQTVKLTTEGIGFLSAGRTNSLFFWDKASKQFRLAPLNR